MKTALIALFFLSASVSADVILFAPSEGQRPNDTNGSIKISHVQTKSDEPKLLRAAFGAQGDSFGQSSPKVTDWSGHKALRFSATNRSEKAASLIFVVRHGGTNNFNTRVDVPLTIKPGTHPYELDLTAIRNNDQSAPQWKSIGHWYIAADGAATVDFADIQLIDDPKNPKPITSARPATDRPQAPPKHKSPLPAIAKPIQFHTPEADKIVAAMQVFPADNAWNEDISQRPVHPRSKAIIATMDPNRHLYFNEDMGFIIVPANQKKIEVKLTDLADESDAGPYPVPDETPIEGWPVAEKDLAKIQREGDGDRHAIVVDPFNFKLYEFYHMRKTDKGWTAQQASIFDLSSNKLRPDGWTSTDAAGLPIFQSVVRFDEVERGMVDHAMRFTARKTRRAYIYPATHFASASNDENLPRMGERFRLRADFDITGFSPHAQAVLKGLKKYGMILADNGVNWAISTAPDSRIKGLDELNRVKGRDFEIIVTTGADEGPRKK